MNFERMAFVGSCNGVARHSFWPTTICAMNNNCNRKLTEWMAQIALDVYFICVHKQLAFDLNIIFISIFGGRNEPSSLSDISIFRC